MPLPYHFRSSMTSCIDHSFVYSGSVVILGGFEDDLDIPHSVAYDKMAKIGIKILKLFVNRETIAPAPEPATEPATEPAPETESAFPLALRLFPS